MIARLKYGAVLALPTAFFFWWNTIAAQAIDADLARKCSALTDRVYPLRVPGNPAAGRLNGSGKALRDYFNQCVAHGGVVDTHDQGSGSGAIPAERDEEPAQTPNQTK